MPDGGLILGGWEHAAWRRPGHVDARNSLWPGSFCIAPGMAWQIAKYAMA